MHAHISGESVRRKVGWAVLWGAHNLSALTLNMSLMSALF